MTTVNIDYTAIGNAAAQGENQQEMKEGGGKFERPVPAAGLAFGRLLQYIELGVQKSNRSDFKDSEQVMLRFEVSTPKHMIEIEKDGVKSKIPAIIDIRLPKGGLTSKYGRLFTQLNYSGKFNHFAQMVGAGSWLFTITHNVVNPGTKEEKTYANLDKNKAWTFAAPQKEDPVTEAITPIPVPELDGTPKVFLYENAGIDDVQYLGLWDTLFIEGEYEAKGDKPAKSKNWIQETIQKSVKFVGSRLHGLTEGRTSGEAVTDVAGLIEEGEAGNGSEGATTQPLKTEEAVTTDKVVETVVTPQDSSGGKTATDDVDPLLDLL